MALTNKFNSKRYAQQQIDTMIDVRTIEMHKVYAPTRVNQNVDTMDLCEMFHADTQYNPLDFDPQWDLKELAKRKTF